MKEVNHISHTENKNENKNRKKKLVFVTIDVSNYNTPFFNGLNAEIKDFAEIYIIYYNKKPVPKSLDPNIKLVPVEGINLLSNPLTRAVIRSPDSIVKYFFWYKNLDKILVEISPDFIQTFLYFMPYSSQVAKYCTKNNVPLISYEESQREPYFVVTKLLNRLVLVFLRKAMIKKIKYIVSSTKQGVDFQSKFLANKNKIIHIPWPVEEQKFLALKRPISKNKTLRLLVIARMVPYKKYDTMLLAMAELKKQKMPFKLTIIGSGPLDTEIKKEVLEYGLEKNVEIIPKVDFEEMKKYYLNSDIVILASVYESYGMIVPESMACGCEVIVSDTAGTNFMVENGKNGYIFKTGDAEDLAKKIVMSKNKTKQFGEHSRKLMKTKFSTKTIINNYLKLIKEI